MPTRPSSDLDWMALQVAALFVHDENGRLVLPNQPGEEHVPPPRFFLGRTAHGNLWRFGAGVSRELVTELARLAAAEGSDRPLEAGPERVEPLRARLAEDGPIEATFHGPAFRFPDPEGLPDPGSGIELVTPGRRELLATHFPDHVETLARNQPFLAVVEQGDAVAVCFCATGAGPVVEAGVETAPGWRRRGHATRVVAAWARAVAREGRHPLYSTTWENVSSRGVARQLGLTLYGADLHFR